MACTNIYIDIGANIGYQIHKLYNPSNCRSPVQHLFDMLGSRSTVCSIMIEPNPDHSLVLTEITKRYYPRVTFLPGLASTSNASTSPFYRNENYINGKAHHAWTGSNIPRYVGQNGVDVRNVDVGRLIDIHSNKNIGMKIDIEGSEDTLLPHIWERLCNFAFVYIELHSTNSRVMYRSVLANLSKRNCPVKMMELDDEKMCNPRPNIGASSTAACYYAFGKSGHVTSPRRWKNLLQSAKNAKVPLVRVKAEETDSAHFNITCCSSVPYLGLWKSNLVLWKQALQTCTHDWVILFENDATIPLNFVRRITPYFEKNDVIWLDSRNGFHTGGSGCCTVGMAYRKSILPQLINEFEPDNPGATWHTWKTRTCLYDWYLFDVVNKLNLRAETVGVVHHPSTNHNKDNR